MAKKGVSPVIPKPMGDTKKNTNVKKAPPIPSVLPKKKK